MKRLKSRILYELWISSLAVFVLVLLGCATTQPRSPDPSAYKSRAKSSISGGVTVTVAVPTVAEAQAIYGVKLAAKHIQPVCLKGIGCMLSHGLHDLFTMIAFDGYSIEQAFDQKGQPAVL